MEKTRYVYTKDKLIELILDLIRLYDEYQDSTVSRVTWQPLAQCEKS